MAFCELNTPNEDTDDKLLLVVFTHANLPRDIQSVFKSDILSAPSKPQAWALKKHCVSSSDVFPYIQTQHMTQRDLQPVKPAE